MDYLSNELGVDRKECAKCYFQFLFQAYKYYPNFVEKMDAIFEKDQQMWRKIIDKAIATGEIRNDIATEEVVDMFRMAHLGMSYVLAFTTGLDTERLKRQFDAVYKLLKWFFWTEIEYHSIFYVICEAPFGVLFLCLHEIKYSEY